MNSRKWLIFLSAVVLILVSGIMTQLVYDAPFMNQFSMLKAYFVAQTDFFAKSISAGYFQWDEMHDAIVNNDFDFIDEQIKDIKKNYPKIEDIKIIESVPPKTLYEISNNGMMMVIRFKILDNSAIKYVPDKIAIVEIPAQSFLSLVPNTPIRLSEDGKPFVYNLKYKRLFSFNNLAVPLFFFVTIVMVLLLILFFSEKHRVNIEKHVSESLESQRKSLQAINEFTQAVLKNILQPSYQYMIEKAVEIVPGAQGGSVLIREGNYFMFSGCVDYNFEQLSKIRLRPNELVQGTQGEIKEIEALGEFDRETFGETENLDILTKYGRIDEIKSTLSIPVIVNNEIVAFLNLDNFEKEDAFTEDSKKIATVFANQLGVLFERIALERELEQQKEQFQYLSTHDSLTGLPNRRLLEIESEKLMALAKRDGKNICCMFLDLKKFKVINLLSPLTRLDNIS
ncbi:diguanylate cyclase [Fervidobacterium islandicum]|uniref:Diguanylate cyclase n=1 Tax=Fervidobacterium islandicum TaxID=2423 RepID=A0AAJ5I4S3_FERIS|nr:diguanylate cyclase [Fervidobacterium islandicum]UOE96797.1 diguanylate cyclase [Fervidobacterium islandicum]